ncbi:MAG TPA: DHA2 family efflux MFS transporter permease subunit [Candidatus Sulfotelmatobacter sp.]|nr:DHA2 family efflux MFS transporter permease subunit [Candidatus Sulfotelmatobacter sp.]
MPEEPSTEEAGERHPLTAEGGQAEHSSPPPSKPHRRMRPYFIFAAAGLSLFMYSIDSTAVAVAFPNFISDFGTTVLWAAWTLSIYMIAVTSVMPLMGNLSDNFGRKPVYVVSLILFTASSLACGLAPNIYALVVCRFVQGVGGASFLPTAAGIVSDQFPKSRERAIGLFSSIFSIGGIVGPNLGGWIVSRFSWRYIFYINLPIGVVLVILILLLLDAPPRADKRPPVDLAGAGLFFAAILCLMLGLNRLADSLAPASWPLTGLFLAASVAGGIIFLRHERRARNPLLDLTLLQSTPFLAANLYNMMLGAGIFGVVSFVPLYATSVHHLSTLLSGMILTPRSVGVICTSTLTSFLLKRWGYRGPMLWGLSIMAAATLLLGDDRFVIARLLGIHWGPAETLAAVIGLLGIAMGVTLPASNNACIELMPSKVATITGLRGMFRFVGGALGISITTIILHTSSTPAAGFQTAYLSFGILLFLALPLVFLMPRGKREWG